MMRACFLIPILVCLGAVATTATADDVAKIHATKIQAAVGEIDRLLAEAWHRDDVTPAPVDIHLVKNLKAQFFNTT